MIYVTRKMIIFTNGPKITYVIHELIYEKSHTYPLFLPECTRADPVLCRGEGGREFPSHGQSTAKGVRGYYPLKNVWFSLCCK